MKKSFTALSLSLIFIFGLTALPFTRATPAKKGANWAQWRGTEGQGISPEKGLPTKWSTTENIKWKTEIPGREHSSPIVWEDRVFVTTSFEGEIKYEGARAPRPARFYASPVAFEDKILLTSEEGDTFVLKAGPKHEVIGTNSLDEPIYASPAIASGNIFIRGAQHLYCIAN